AVHLSAARAGLARHTDSSGPTATRSLLTRDVIEPVDTFIRYSALLLELTAHGPILLCGAIKTTLGHAPERSEGYGAWNRVSGSAAPGAALSHRSWDYAGVPHLTQGVLDITDVSRSVGSNPARSEERRVGKG